MSENLCTNCGDELIEKGERDGEGLCHECYCIIRDPFYIINSASAPAQNG